ncbi:uncharacterized protein LOC123916572 [Trifolium pratense]|uniref:uncharacterized protein LOC123899573 n=1 Tax=Trifolium pratense TaxID=57577 RepID=UPI001E6924F8|nr:uncharacterized protein LOC123899573 [Trifolium pratense]XP_045824009.1 uncharacterized protein LOC123916572 [Trifolium pratense]
MKRRTLKSKELEIDSHGNFSQLANSLPCSVIISPPITPPSIGKPYESCVQEQKDTRYFNLEGSLPRPSCFHAGQTSGTFESIDSAFGVCNDISVISIYRNNI